VSWRQFAKSRLPPIGSDLESHIDAASATSSCRRSAALFLTRCLGARGVIPETDRIGSQHLQWKLIALIESGIPDIAEFLHFSEKKQTIDKFNALRDFHQYCLEKLRLLSILPADPDAYVSRRHDVFQLLNNRTIKSYLNSYDFSRVSEKIRNTMTGIKDLLEINDVRFGNKLQQQMDVVKTEINCAERHSDFLVRRAYLPFYEPLLRFLQRLIANQFSDLRAM
jgi:hypothetical protein